MFFVTTRALFTLFCHCAPLRCLIWEGYGATVVPAAPGVFSFGASRFLEGQVGYFSNRGWVRSGYVHKAGKCCFTLTVDTTLEWGGLQEYSNQSIDIPTFH